MSHETIINGKRVMLSDEDCEKEAQFHRSRIPFAWVNNSIVFNRNPADVRDHLHWLTEDYQMTLEKFEELPRGYIKDDRVQFFIGTAFKPIPHDYLELLLTNKTLRILNKTYFDAFVRRDSAIHSIGIPLYNGVHVGKIGDVWEPIELFCNYNFLNTHKK